MLARITDGRAPIQWSATVCKIPGVDHMHYNLDVPQMIQQIDLEDTNT